MWLRTMNLSKFTAWLWYGVMWCPCYALSQALFRFRAMGRSGVPKTGPVLLLSNHQSHLDPVLIGLACPRQLRYLARKGLFFFPFGLWIRALGAVPIDQEGSALAGIRRTLDLLKQGNAVLVFTEGSRTPDGNLHKMMPGFCLLARRSKATIVPIAVDGAYSALKRGSFYPRPNPIALAFEAPLTPAQYEQLSDAELTELVTRRIERAFAHTRQELSTMPRFSRFWAARRPNRLLAGLPEPAIAAEKSL
jgi:1-acyl-sn-glycerol-3-phosphate acyltransferase